MGRVNPGDREDSRALEFKLPPPMDLALGESGIWLCREVTEDLEDSEVVGLSAPKAPKEW